MTRTTACPASRRAWRLSRACGLLRGTGVFTLRRGILAVLAWCVLAAPAWAAAGFVQAECAGPTSSTSDVSAVFDSSPATNAVIWVGVGWLHTADDTVTVTVTDSSGVNTYVAPTGAKAVNPGSGGAQGFYVVNAAMQGPTMQITATMTDNSGHPSQLNLCIAELSGVDPMDPLDDDTIAEADGVSSLDVGTLTTTTNGIAVTLIQATGDRTFAVPVNYTAAHVQTNRFMSAYRVTGSAGSYGATWTWTGGTSNVAGVHMGFKAAAGGGGATPCYRSLLGVGC